MKVIEGDYKDSQAVVITSSAHGTVLELRARLLTERGFKLMNDISSMRLLDKTESHRFSQWLIMGLLAISIIGLLVAIPMYLWGKNTEFKVEVKARSGERFVLQGDKEDWKSIKPYIS